MEIFRSFNFDDFRAILEAEDQNLFFVDWSLGARTFVYAKAQERVSGVGKVIGEFINFLVDNAGLKLDKLNLIGFSLGGDKT